MKALLTPVASVLLAAVVISHFFALPAHAQVNADPFLWLEDKDGSKAMAWVHEQNARTLPILQGDPRYKQLAADALRVAQAKGRIPAPEIFNDGIYNFWQDETHVRGIWRRTSAASYASDAPRWTTVLDLDAVSKAENANWVWKGDQCTWPDERRCLIFLSNGGEDAMTVREFDMTSASFVRNGFDLPRGKQSVAWEDDDTLLVAREWNPGDLTASGYPFVVKRLKRGQALADATEVFRGEKSDVEVDPFTVADGSGNKLAMIRRGVTFFTSHYELVTKDGVKQIALPEKCDVEAMVQGRIVVNLNENWTVNGTSFTAGSLVAIDAAALSADPQHLKPALVFAPGPRESVDGVNATKSQLVVAVYENVRGRAYVFTPGANDTWTSKRLDLPDNSSIGIVDADANGTLAYVSVTGFLTPTTLWSADTQSGNPSVVKSMPALFDASKDVVEQVEAASSDGTEIPYFIVHPKNMQLDGSNPTILTAYGGFQVSMTPSYSGTVGKLWLERGGVYVLANIRGGGEFGPAWHEAGLTTKRQIIYDDFYAVAHDLVTRKITSPRRLGIMGGSNGGLLMGVEFVEHPNAWNAVDIQVPLLDMLRYEQIQAGASWVGEYGSISDPAVKAFWEAHSPYQNVKADVTYPEPFIWSTTKDDRVGPQHARKFAAKLAAMHKPYLYYEVTEGGHGAGANLKESAMTWALQYTYFAQKLME
jgi:prolyl oligopeptidase